MQHAARGVTGTWELTLGTAHLGHIALRIDSDLWAVPGAVEVGFLSHVECRRGEVSLVEWSTERGYCAKS